MPTVSTPLLRFARGLLLLVVGAALPAHAQLDIPGYVPCYPGANGALATASPAPLALTIDTRDVRQTVRNFGASDAWSIQFVGQWPLAKREAIADLLFETGLDANREPRGIGLSMWRFNLGAGSSRQTNIRYPWRTADTFYDEDFSDYDWTRLPGQRWFLQAAKARGVDQTTAFVNSPPINMTKNGQARADRFSGSTNLSDDKFDDFARYLADIVAHFRDVEGIDFTAISPVNEPQWSWQGRSQEGNRYSTGDIKRVVDALADVDLGNTQIETPESGENKYFYEDELDDYVDAFFDPASPDYIADELDDTVAGHSYWSDLPPDLVASRERLRSKLDEYPGLAFAMSEYSILGNDGYGNGRDLGIDPAIYILRTLHYDMTIAEAVSWQWWLGVSPYDYKDGLVYVDKNEQDGNFYESKMLWGLGNYSRFVRPGMRRVIVRRSDGATPRQNVNGLMVSAYVDPPHNVAVTVLVNSAEESSVVALEFDGMAIDSAIPYVTSADDDLAPYALLSPSDSIEIPARSIVTLVAYHSQRSLPPLEVPIAIHTGVVPVARSGAIPVSIPGGTDFDVREIDRTTLEFGPGGASPAHRSGGHLDDEDGDGRDDLVVHFGAREAGFDADDTAGCVRGRMTGGRTFRGCDAIRAVAR